jgi:hypothetical protein
MVALGKVGGILAGRNQEKQAETLQENPVCANIHGKYRHNRKMRLQM